MRMRMAMGPAMAAALLCGAAQAQLLPGSIGALPGQVVGGVLSPTTRQLGGVVDTLGIDRTTAALEPRSLREVRRARLRALIDAHRAVLEADKDGNPARRGEVIAIDPAPGLLDRARAEGFTLLRQERIDGLGFAVAILRAPKGEDGRGALKRLRKLDPQGQFELNHVFEPAGAALGLANAAALATGKAGAGKPIGMIDGGVAAHPALGAARIEQRGFVAGAPRASGHGTAIASLLVGRDGRFHGAAVGHALLVADVYGGDPASGSAEAIARAIGWLAASGARIVNISLIGPPNRLIGRAVQAAQARGLTIVAAVGNDGPAAPPQYPASYPGVVAVTGVDARDRALAEAGRAAHLDFAAPGADMAAALPGQGYAVVRGTSFAAPLVTARFAALGGDRAAVAREARPGHGKVGRGIICKPCRIAPAEMGLKK